MTVKSWKLIAFTRMSKLLKEPCHRNKSFLYMKDITFLNSVHYVKIWLKPPFTSKIADQAEIVRVKGFKKQAIVSGNGSNK